MIAKRHHPVSPSGRSLAIAIILFGLTACEASPKSGRCAFVDLEHLARPRDFGGKTLICNPKRVSAAYRDRYFPGYQWGDETW